MSCLAWAEFLTMMIFCLQYKSIHQNDFDVMFRKWPYSWCHKDISWDSDIMNMKKVMKKNNYWLIETMINIIMKKVNCVKTHLNDHKVSPSNHFIGYISMPRHNSGTPSFWLPNYGWTLNCYPRNQTLQTHSTPIQKS